MIEIKGNLWDFYQKMEHIICITTNGFVKINGEAVCGRGCALEATKYIPGFAKMLGSYITQYGNVPGTMRTTPDEWGIVVFPVKHKWNEKASENLILAGAHWLFDRATQSPDITWVLPRPGCGNGGLHWEGNEGVHNLISFLPNNVHVISKAIKNVIS